MDISSDAKPGAIVSQPYVTGVGFVPTSRGLFAMVSAEDLDDVMSFRWYTEFNHRNWYAARREGTRTIRMHNHITDICCRSFVPDHKNMDGLDNRRDNLQVLTNGQNRRRTAQRRAHANWHEAMMGAV